MRSEVCEKCGGTGEKIDPKVLREKRDKSGLTAATVAARMDISASYLSDLEQGRRDWDAKLLADFLKAIK